MERDQDQQRRYRLALEKRQAERAEIEKLFNAFENPFDGDPKETQDLLLQLERSAREKRLMVAEEVPASALGLTREELDHPLFRYIREDNGCTRRSRDIFKDLVRDRSRGDHLNDETDKWLAANLGSLVPGCETMNRRTAKARLLDEWGISLSDGTLKQHLPERSRKKPEKG